MEEVEFEGSSVLEQLAQAGNLDRFLEAVDADDFQLAASIMRQSRIDQDVIQHVLNKMREADLEH